MNRILGNPNDLVFAAPLKGFDVPEFTVGITICFCHNCLFSKLSESQNTTCRLREGNMDQT